MTLFENFDIEEIEKDIRTKLDNISNMVYKKPVLQLSKDEAVELISLELSIFHQTMSIYAAEKRSTEVQFNMNDYSVGLTLNLEGMSKVMLEIVERQKTTADAITKFVRLRSTAFKLLEAKYLSNEEFLRHLIRQAEIKDGAQAIGRHKQ